MLGSMPSNPRGDNPVADAVPPAWQAVLAHRAREPRAVVDAVIARFQAAGLTPDQVATHLADGGDRLYADARSGDTDWAQAHGGPRAAALLAAEVGALMSHLVARAASVRAVSVDALLDDFSAVTVAGALGVARQKVYDLAKTEIDPDYLTEVPWRTA